MDYFVSIENCQFFRWQIELLYESMKFYGLENNLVIACANLENKQLRFKKVFYHENIGRNNNYLPLNKTFSLQIALENNIIKQPFVVVDPDMVMVRPMLELNFSYVNFYKYLIYENLLNIGYDGFGIKKEDWVPGGFIYYFNNCDDSILKNIHKDLIKLIEIYNEDKNDYRAQEVDYWQREMVAFAIALSKLKAKIKYNLQCTLYDVQSDCNFIHYCNGFQPFFNKRTHNNLRPFSISGPLPFDNILSMPNININIKKLKDIALRYLENNKDNKI